MTNQQLTTPVTGAGSVIGRAAGLEPASPGQPNAGTIETTLERNRAFGAADGHQRAVDFPNPRLFVITCLDPRVDPAPVLGLSDAIVERNVGGRVTQRRSATSPSPAKSPTTSCRTAPCSRSP
jgi:hypothetical protein